MGKKFWRQLSWCWESDPHSSHLKSSARGCRRHLAELGYVSLAIWGKEQAGFRLTPDQAEGLAKVPPVQELPRECSRQRWKCSTDHVWASLALSWSWPGNGKREQSTGMTLGTWGWGRAHKASRLEEVHPSLLRDLQLGRPAGRGLRFTRALTGNHGRQESPGQVRTSLHPFFIPPQPHP